MKDYECDCGWIPLWRGVGAFTADRQGEDGQYPVGFDVPWPHESVETADRVCIERRPVQA